MVFEHLKNAGIVEEEKSEKKKDWWKSSDSESDSKSDSDRNGLSASDSEEIEKPHKKKDKRVYEYECVSIRFKTLEQLLEEQNEGGDDKEVQPIVFTDHTGRKQQQRVLGDSAVASVNRNAVGFEMIYNIEKLTSAEEVNVLTFASKTKRRDEIKQEKQVLVSKMKSELEQQTSSIRNLETLLRTIDDFSKELSSKTPLDVLLLMEDFQMEYPVEYYRYKLFQLFPSLFQPAVQTHFIDWNPLTEAKKFEELAYHVKDIMLIEEDTEESRLFTYDWMENPSKKHESENRFLVVSVFTNTLLPIIRDALTKHLNVFDDNHFENYLILLKVARFIWDDTVVLNSITRPVLIKLKSMVFVHIPF